MTSGDLAVDSCAQFLAVAEHWLIPTRARSVCHQLGKAGYQSVWSPAQQDQVAPLVITLSGLLLARIGLLVVTLGKELLVLLVPPLLFPPLLHLS